MRPLEGADRPRHQAVPAYLIVRAGILQVVGHRGEHRHRRDAGGERLPGLREQGVDRQEVAPRHRGDRVADPVALDHEQGQDHIGRPRSVSGASRRTPSPLRLRRGGLVSAMDPAASTYRPRGADKLSKAFFAARYFGVRIVQETRREKTLFVEDLQHLIVGTQVPRVQLCH